MKSSSKNSKNYGEKEGTTGTSVLTERISMEVAVLYSPLLYTKDRTELTINTNQKLELNSNKTENLSSTTSFLHHTDHSDIAENRFFFF